MDAATIENNAKKADLGMTAPYQHFSDKGEILCRLANEQVETTKPLKRVFDEGLCIFI
ncbi:MAG: hypothetical protein K9N55_17905 [Phycisphaerae bacterium]|nr:hypothetical protein [Phycisphaerae bacterium]